ncbi:hypothetical protein NDA14_005786 [Ustilago hordei]|nr:hypothetical protein NDA14_005786 [Ustilago hordei]
MSWGQMIVQEEQNSYEEIWCNHCELGESRVPTEFGEIGTQALLQESVESAGSHSLQQASQDLAQEKPLSPIWQRDGREHGKSRHCKKQGPCTMMKLVQTNGCWQQEGDERRQVATQMKWEWPPDEDEVAQGLSIHKREGKQCQRAAAQCGWKMAGQIRRRHKVEEASPSRSSVVSQGQWASI